MTESSKNSPSLKRIPKRGKLAGTVIHDAVIPVTVAGQKYVSPASRHSQTSHAQAKARGLAGGLNTERALYEADRTAISDGIAHVAAVKVQQDRNKAK